jgi:type I restriction enzyme M protein
MAIDPAAPLTLRALEDHLWRSADLFRNKISNQKDYVLALLFFKRASDRHREETAAALGELAEQGVPGDAAAKIIAANPKAYHSILIPDDHSWEDVRNTDRDGLGRALNDALTAVGRANPTQLAGVFEHTDFNNKTALPAEDLAEVINHFEELGPLTNERVTPDMLGQGYEWLIAKFAATSGKGGGEFYTPAAVGNLGAKLLAPRPSETAYDPTCGSGGLLLQVLDEARRVHDDAARSLTLFGQELNPETWAIARMNMLLHGAAGVATIERGDTLKEPRFLDGDGIRQFDVIIANPPFSPRNWGHERLKNEGDPFERIKHVPPKSHGEMAFVQHMIASLGERGRMAIVLPNGVFFRGGAEQAVRKELIDGDLVEAVIQLPKDMFYGAGIPACYLVINKAKRKARQDKILFIDASDCFERRDSKNVLRDDDIRRIAAAVHEDHDNPNFATSVDTKTVEQKKFVLLPGKYVLNASVDEAAESLGDAVANWRQQDGMRDEASTAITSLANRVAAVDKPVTLKEFVLSDLLQPYREAVTLEDDVTYTQVTVQYWGRGVVARGTQPGISIGTKRQNIIRPGKLVLSKIDARNGSIGIVPAELDGAIVTPDFPVFSIDTSVCLPEYFALLAARPAFWEMCLAVSEGSTNRVRLNVGDFLAQTVELPEPEIQQQFVEGVSALDHFVTALRGEIETVAAWRARLVSDFVAGLAVFDDEISTP